MMQISDVFPWYYQLLFMVLEVCILTDSWHIVSLVNAPVAKCDIYCTFLHSSITIKPFPLPRTV